jgi:hypothetical protein
MTGTRGPAKPVTDAGLETTSPRDRPATKSTPMTGTRGIGKPPPAQAEEKPADPAPAPAK